jgi:hypothetical protein
MMTRDDHFGVFMLFEKREIPRSDSAAGENAASLSELGMTKLWRLQKTARLSGELQMHRSFGCAPINFARETVIRRFAHDDKGMKFRLSAE